MIPLILFILLILVFFSVSSAIIYHIFRYSPEKKSSLVLIAVYGGVSLILIIAAFSAYVSIDWKEFL